MQIKKTILTESVTLEELNLIQRDVTALTTGKQASLESTLTARHTRHATQSWLSMQYQLLK